MLNKFKKRQRRTLQLEGVFDEQDPNVCTLSFSSETPVNRGWYVEILSHEAGAALLERIKEAGPLLFNHIPDFHLGRVLDAWIENKRGYVRVKFSQNPTPQEKRRDVEDKILVNVSFGYEIFRDFIKPMPEVDGEPPHYLMTRWEAFEVSLVTIPADVTVGIGRNLPGGDEEFDLPSELVASRSQPEQTRELTPTAEPSEPPNQEPKVQVLNNNERTRQMTPEELQKAANKRAATIISMGEKHGQMEFAREFLKGEGTEADFALQLVEKIQGARQHALDPNPIDFTEREAKNYSIVRALNAQMNKDWSKAGFEREVSMELAKRAGGKATDGFFMPNNIAMRAPLSAGVAAAGGVTVQTEVRGDMFIDMLRKRAVLFRAGAVFLTGLVGNVSIPRLTGGTSFYWINENGTITESEASFDQVPLAPKTIAAVTAVTRQLLAQSSINVDSLIVDDLNKSIALGIDQAGLCGNGTGGEPTGVMNQAGINSVALGDNGGDLALDTFIDLETAVAEAEADVMTMAYITNARTVGKAKKLKDTTGRQLWSQADKGAPGQMNGYDVLRTNMVPRNLTKGTGENLSAILFGDWSQLLIGGWMAGTEILVNPYGDGYKKGNIEVRAMNMVDVAVRQAKAFSACTDVK